MSYLQCNVSHLTHIPFLHVSSFYTVMFSILPALSFSQCIVLGFVVRACLYHQGYEKQGFSFVRSVWVYCVGLDEMDIRVH